MHSKSKSQTECIQKVIAADFAHQRPSAAVTCGLISKSIDSPYIWATSKTTVQCSKLPCSAESLQLHPRGDGAATLSVNTLSAAQTRTCELHLLLPSAAIPHCEPLQKARMTAETVGHPKTKNLLHYPMKARVKRSACLRVTSIFTGAVHRLQDRKIQQCSWMASKVQPCTLQASKAIATDPARLYRVYIIFTGTV